MKRNSALGFLFVCPVRPVKVDRAGRKDDRLRISILAIRLGVLGSSIRRVHAGTCIDVYVCACMCTNVSCHFWNVYVLNVR